MNRYQEIRDRRKEKSEPDRFARIDLSPSSYLLSPDKNPEVSYI